MDWAVSVDHVDVLNESVGLQRRAGHRSEPPRAVQPSGGRSGRDRGRQQWRRRPGEHLRLAGSDPSAIAVGASTELRTLKETGFAAGDLLGAGWLNNNISYFSSSGFTDNGRTLDLVAPGDTGLETCTANSVYQNSTTSTQGHRPSTYYFAGTSESAPMVAGAAALVIEAYRNSHMAQPHAGPRAPDPAQHRGRPRLPEQRAGRGTRGCSGRRPSGRDRQSGRRTGVAGSSAGTRPRSVVPRLTGSGRRGRVGLAGQSGRSDGEQSIQRHRAHFGKGPLASRPVRRGARAR